MTTTHVYGYQVRPVQLEVLTSTVWTRDLSYYGSYRPDRNPGVITCARVRHHTLRPVRGHRVCRTYPWSPSIWPRRQSGGLLRKYIVFVVRPTQPGVRKSTTRTHYRRHSFWPDRSPGTYCRRTWSVVQVTSVYVHVPPGRRPHWPDRQSPSPQEVRDPSRVKRNEEGPT